MKQWLVRNHQKTVSAAFVVVFLLMVGAGVFISYQLSSLSHRSDQQDKVITQLASSLDTSRKQLTKHGITPSAPPASKIIQEVPGAQGAQGIPGVAGSNGKNGTNGKDGSPGPTGPTGPPGPTGSPGTDGTNGVDGQQGAQGLPGKDGTNGTDGKDGQPPTGWTFSFSPDGGLTTVTESCSRVSDFDPNNPQYTCSPSSSGANDASDVGGKSENKGISLVGLSLIGGTFYRGVPIKLA